MNYIILQGDSVLLALHGNACYLPEDKDLPESWLKKLQLFPLLGSKETYLVCSTALPEVNGLVYGNLRANASRMSRETYALICQAKAISNWDHGHRFCGLCGAELLPLQEDKSKTCPSCKHQWFPEIACAIIVGIRKGNSLLMAHNAHFPEGLYSLVAGFIELGETCELAVAREVMEEVGIRVHNIHYFASQPWPFPNSLMMGFTAEYAEGEVIPDGTELLDAGWYTADHLPPSIPKVGTIARAIIDDFFASQSQ
ncbi:MAG: NAD(+) diphosphatase [Spirochaetia bacterium]|nr:NAD(+) diphosphatase [Spirochaetia bacterium]